jgi:hypothetical protein
MLNEYQETRYGHARDILVLAKDKVLTGQEMFMGNAIATAAKELIPDDGLKLELLLGISAILEELVQGSGRLLIEVLQGGQQEAGLQLVSAALKEIVSAVPAPKKGN